MAIETPATKGQKQMIDYMETPNLAELDKNARFSTGDPLESLATGSSVVPATKTVASLFIAALAPSELIIYI